MPALASALDAAVALGVAFAALELFRLRRAVVRYGRELNPAPPAPDAAALRAVRAEIERLRTEAWRAGQSEKR